MDFQRRMQAQGTGARERRAQKGCSANPCSRTKFLKLSLKNGETSVSSCGGLRSGQAWIVFQVNGMPRFCIGADYPRPNRFGWPSGCGPSATVRDSAETVARLRPGSGEAHYAAGMYDQLVRRDFVSAREHFACAVRLQPNNADAWSLLALSEFHLGRWARDPGTFEKSGRA